MKTKEGNILINNFMGKQVDPVNYSSLIFRSQGYYHKDWNWLMPVLGKINNLKSLEKDSEWYDFTIQNRQISKDNYETEETSKDYIISYTTYIGRVGEYSINLGKICSNNSSTMISSVWNCVIEFIQWYNDNK